MWDTPTAPRGDPNGRHASKPRKEKNNIETKTNSNDMKRIPATTVLCLCTLLLSACSNEDFPEQVEGEKPCDYICFGISPDESAQTKGSVQAKAKEYTSDRFVLRSADSADTLCVRTIVSEGIQGAAADQAITRGTPITNDNFYDKFHVLTTLTRSNNTDIFFNEDVSKTGSYWTTDQTYYWPGADYELQFYAWAPADAITAPSSPENLTFEYTVPEEATAQQDLVVANESRDGNFNQAVSLSFNHICTAVKFVVGDEMQAGTIKSVALKGVKNTGTYDMKNGKWSLEDATTDFTQTLTDYKTYGNEKPDTEITPTKGTFMMLPQTLPDGASVEVVFQDGATGSERTLSATIGGTEWPMGKTVTYKLSITPEYEFKLDDADKDKVLDAHFEIFKTNLIVSGVPDGQSWTVTAPNFGAGTLNAVTIQTQSDMNTYSANQGFWTDRYFNDRNQDTGSARGESTYSGTGSGTFPIAIFVPENVGDATRDIKLSIQVNGNNTDQTIIFQQLSPSWFGNGNLGCERIEGTPAPWGFYWTSNYKLIYDVTGCSNNDRTSLRRYIEWSKTLKTLSNIPFIGDIIKWIFGENIPDLYYVEMVKSDGSIWTGGDKADKITINLGMLEAAGIALSTTDGQSNTREIYNYEGIQYANTIISRIESCSGYNKSQEGTGTNPSYNASIACMKLNSWNIYKAQDENLLRLTNEDANPSWYLPAKDEVSGIADSEHHLEGDYWSSTAENNNTNAYKYSADGSIVTAVQRDAVLNVRAVRTKP